ncbi:MAG: HAMP domain-containing histidine kinase, partial [Geodermatophilaceae bacterium]|nr:HAMP domain-containing histidine kinase [Geodermatophilaceae bacterium]
MAVAVLAAVLAISLFGGPLAVGVATVYRADENTELERVADAAAIAVAGDLVQGQLPELLAPRDNETALALYDTAGRLIAGVGPTAADTPVRAALTGVRSRAVLSGDLIVAVPVIEDGRVLAVVRSATARSQLYLRVALTWGLMLVLAAGAVVVTWLVARRQALRLTAPLSTLSAAAQELGDGNFVVRPQPSGIDEIDTVARSLASTADRLGALLARERSFAADASHQLRTPLTGLRLRLEDALTAPGDAAVGLRAGLDDIDRLERTIEDLLSLRQDSSPGAHLRVADLIGEIEAGWHGLLAAAGRPLRVVVEADLPPCLAAPAAVRQILGVLLDNAVRHGAGTVSLTVRDAGGVLAVDVTDEGAGIDRTEAELFERRSAQARGHGIG